MSKTSCVVWRRFRLVAVWIFVLTLGVSASAQRVVLVGGSSIEGVILQDNAERVVIDLGVTVLTLSRESVLEVKPLGEESVDGVETDTWTSGLFQQVAGGRERPVQDLVKEVGEAVVEIRSNAGIGSGFVIHPDGFLITNHHVINGEHRLIVTLFRREAQSLMKETFRNVRIVALDAVRDLALLKIDDDPDRQFVHVGIADSDLVRPGQPVFAVGSPLGFDRTVSQGIVSLPNRIMEGTVYIQTTAQINPGNSGGPLFNLRGQVVGVNNRKAMSVGIEGVGFAIPSSVLTFFITKRDAFAFDPRNPNTGYRYLSPPGKHLQEERNDQL